MAQQYENENKSQLKERACQLAADGRLQREIAQELGLPVRTFYNWMEADPSFRQAFQRAQENGSYILAELMVSTAETEEPRKAQAINNARAFILERRYRKLWAPSQDVNINQQIDLSGALIEARKRVSLPRRDPAELARPVDAEYSITYDRNATDYVSVPAPGALDADASAPASSADAPDVDPFS